MKPFLVWQFFGATLLAVTLNTVYRFVVGSETMHAYRVKTSLLLTFGFVMLKV